MGGAWRRRGRSSGSCFTCSTSGSWKAKPSPRARRRWRPFVTVALSGAWSGLSLECCAASSARLEPHGPTSVEAPPVKGGRGYAGQMATQLPEAALVVMLSFVAYLRPAEPFRLLARQVVAPYPAAGKGHQWWSVVLHPLEGERASKTGEFDESMKALESES